MKILKTTDNGGFPAVLDDIRWLQNAFAEVLANLATINGQNSFIIWGCEPTVIGSLQGHTAGAVFINGEMCLVDADTVGIDPADSANWVWEKVVTMDPAGLKVYEDTTAHDTYQITKAVLVVDAAPVGDYALYPIPTMATLVAQSITPLAIQFQKTIGLHKGGTASLAAGAINFGSDGNTFDLPYVDGDVITGFAITSVFYPAGTPVIVRFVGSSAADTITVHNGGINTPNGVDQVFRHLNYAIFVSTGGGNFDLVTTGSPSRKPITGYPNLLNGWTAVDFNIRMNSDSQVMLDGVINGSTVAGVATQIYELPVGYRPKVNIYRMIRANLNGTITDITIQIDTNGFISINVPITVASTAFDFNGISFYAL